MKKVFFKTAVSALFAAIILLAGCSGRYMEVVIQSSSMKPEFQLEDVVAIDTEFDPKTLEVGDIVAYEWTNDPMEEKWVVVHRIIDIEEKDGIRYFQLKGDNNEVPDFEDGELLSEDKIIGKYDHTVRSKRK